LKLPDLQEAEVLAVIALPDCQGRIQLDREASARLSKASRCWVLVCGGDGGGAA
jgi:hypothetical protein